MRTHQRLLTALFLAFSINSSYAALPNTIDNQPLPSLAPMLQKNMPAVVNISTTSLASESRQLRNSQFREFFNLPQQKKRIAQSLGSGVIIDRDKGYIITNHHVIEGASKIEITLQDGRTIQADLLGSDAETDVALLQIQADNLTQLTISDSNQLQVGDFVVAIGNPFGLGQTATSGMVSALGRSGLGIEGYEDFIQTDASINPGNSGGALVNLRGELVGMNTAILSQSGGSVGIGFAIPSSMVMQLVEQLAEYGRIQRGYIGVEVQDLDQNIAQAFGLDFYRGVIITNVEPNSPAAQAGLQNGDIVKSLNGKTIHNAGSLRTSISLIRAGNDFQLDIIRDQRKRQLTLTVGEIELTEILGKDLHPRLAGSLVGTVQNRRGDTRIGLEQVQRFSPAWEAGLRSGDIIIASNKQDVHSINDFKHIIQTSNGRITVLVQRNRRQFFLQL